MGDEEVANRTGHPLSGVIQRRSHKRIPLAVRQKKLWTPLEDRLLGTPAWPVAAHGHPDAWTSAIANQLQEASALVGESLCSTNRRSSPCTIFFAFSVSSHDGAALV